MNGPDYRTAAEYFRDKAHAEKRARLDGTETMIPPNPHRPPAGRRPERVTMRTRCLITGCALVLDGAADYAWGDLHVSGDRFVFVAVADHVTGGMGWFPPDDRLERARVIHVPFGEDYFTRANVFVCRASSDLLNARAVAYLQPSEGLKE